MLEPEVKKKRKTRKKIILEEDETEPVCGITTSPFSGTCEAGVSTYKEYCKFNNKTRKCVKNTSKTWKELEKIIKDEVEQQKMLQESRPVVCGIQTNPFSKACIEGVTTHSEYCKVSDRGTCVKKTNKTWNALEKELTGKN